MALNKKALLELASYIEAADRFTLANFYVRRDSRGRGISWTGDAKSLWEDCNTTGCVAGWQNALMDRDFLADTNAARHDLGLSYEEAFQLFYGGDVWKQVIKTDPMTTATAKHAVKLLRGLANGKYVFTLGESD